MHHMIAHSKKTGHLHTAIGISFCLLSLGLFPAATSAQQLYTTDGVNVRSQPNASASICTTVETGTSVTKTGQEGNWIAIDIHGITGYIYKDYLSETPNTSQDSSTSVSNTASPTSTYINSTEVNLRKKPNSHCKILAVLEPEEQVSLLSQTGNWSKIQRNDGSEGYVYSIYLGENKPEAPSGSAQPQISKEEAIDAYRSDAISYGEQHLGDTYSQSLRDTDGYADCSSLVRDAFAAASGQWIGDTTVTQADTMSNYFYSIDKITDAAPGDLLYHLSSDNHTGIYLGDGKVLHASQKSGCVTISDFDLDGSYWEYGCNAASFCYDQN